LELGEGQRSYLAGRRRGRFGSRILGISGRVAFRPEIVCFIGEGFRHASTSTPRRFSSTPAGCSAMLTRSAWSRDFYANYEIATIVDVSRC